MQSPRFVFFGTPKLSVIVLEQLKEHNLLPTLVVTAPDKPAGRGMKMQASPVKVWAEENDIPTIEPEKFTDDILQKLRDEQSDVFVVVAYGKILPQAVLDAAPHGILNVHPSLLPELRGPSPVRSAILNDMRTTGVTVMKIDAKMDHGPILMQEVYEPPVWPPNAQELDEYLFVRGGQLLAEAMPQYVAGDLEPQEQDHDAATYCKMFDKEDGLLDLNDDPYTNLLKIHAYAGWPGTYFFANDGTRIKVLSAHIGNEKLVIDDIIPEGKNKTTYTTYLQNL